MGPLYMPGQAPWPRHVHAGNLYELRDLLVIISGKPCLVGPSREPPVMRARGDIDVVRIKTYF